MVALLALVARGVDRVLVEVEGRDGLAERAREGDDLRRRRADAAHLRRRRSQGARARPAVGRARGALVEDARRDVPRAPARGKTRGCGPAARRGEVAAEGQFHFLRRVVDAEVVEHERDGGAALGALLRLVAGHGGPVVHDLDARAGLEGHVAVGVAADGGDERGHLVDDEVLAEEDELAVAAGAGQQPRPEALAAQPLRRRRLAVARHNVCDARTRRAKN